MESDKNCCRWFLVWCIFSASFLAVRYSQYVHAYGFSPVCTRLCLIICQLNTKPRPQVGQWYGLPPAWRFCVTSVLYGVDDLVSLTWEPTSSCNVASISTRSAVEFEGPSKVTENILIQKRNMDVWILTERGSILLVGWGNLPCLICFVQALWYWCCVKQTW